MTNERWHYSVLIDWNYRFSVILKFCCIIHKATIILQFVDEKDHKLAHQKSFFQLKQNNSNRLEESYRSTSVSFPHLSEISNLKAWKYAQYSQRFSIWNYSSFSTSWLLYRSLSSLIDMLHFNKADCPKLWNLQTMDLLFIKWVVILSTTDIWNKMKQQDPYWNRVLCTNRRFSIIHIFEKMYVNLEEIVSRHEY